MNDSIWSETITNTLKRKDFITCKVKGWQNRKEQLFPTFDFICLMLGFSEVLVRLFRGPVRDLPSMQSWLHEVPMRCSLPANLRSHWHVGPSAVQEEWTSNERRNYFCLVIVISRLLLDFLYLGKVIIADTVRSADWAIQSEVNLMLLCSGSPNWSSHLHWGHSRQQRVLLKSRLMTLLWQTSYRSLPWWSDLFLSVPKISALDQPSPCLLQLSYFISYFTICFPMRARDFLCRICWLISHMSASFPSRKAFQI